MSRRGSAPPHRRVTSLRCDACGRELAADTNFCPYCGVDRRAPLTPDRSSAPPPAVSALAPPTVVEDAPAPAATTLLSVSPSVIAEPAAPSSTGVAPVPPPQRKRRKRIGCATPLLVLLLAILAGVSWRALHRSPGGGAPAVAGAVAIQPVHVSRRWRTVRLPGDAPASARFVVSSDTALRVRAAGRSYAVRPGRPLRLPEDAGESFDLRAADYVSPEDAAKAKAALSTLRGG